MLLVDRAQFRGLIHIPNANQLNPNDDLYGTGNLLDEELNSFEREILLKCLGSKLFNRLKDYITSDEENQALKSLVTGDTYEVDGVQYEWKGIKSKNTTFIAYYCYYQHVFNNQEQFTGSDVVENTPSNTASNGSHHKLALVWSKMHSWIVGENTGQPVIFHRSHGVGVDWMGCQNTDKSLYQYINDMNDLDGRFDDWYPSAIETINSFGI